MVEGEKRRESASTKRRRGRGVFYRWIADGEGGKSGVGGR